MQKKLTQKAKAARYDILMEELQNLVTNLTDMATDIDNIENRADVKEARESLDNIHSYHAYLAGILKAQGYGIRIKLISAENTLRYYNDPQYNG